MKGSRGYQEKLEKLGGEQTTPVDTLTAVNKIKSVARDWESVDLAIRLGVNTRKAEQNIRGTTVLPKGTGKTARVVVFCKEDKLQEAREAGADEAGLDELLDKIAGGWVDFDMAVATPDVMKDVSRVAKVLGPRGLMPNPKSGTVTPNVKEALEEIKSGKVEFRVDKTGIIHTSIGRGSFSAEDLKANLDHLMNVVVKTRPSTVKGQYVKSVNLSSTQSPVVRLDPGAFTN